eukprot:11207903-Lingulodinium_polyedra.AAC.1
MFSGAIDASAAGGAKRPLETAGEGPSQQQLEYMLESLAGRTAGRTAQMVKAGLLQQVETIAEKAASKAVE